MVLVNPNIASVQASKHEVDKVYFQPVRPSILEQIIQRERPDSIVLAVGGQLALDCGRMLDKEVPHPHFLAAAESKPKKNLISLDGVCGWNPPCLQLWWFFASWKGPPYSHAFTHFST